MGSGTYIGIDPGTESISLALVCRDLTAPHPEFSLLAATVVRPSNPKTKALQRLPELIQSWLTRFAGTGSYFKAEKVAVEGQHFFDRKKDPSDIIHLAMSAGISAMGAAEHLCYHPSGVKILGPGQWSRMEKGMRAKRIKDIYFSGRLSKQSVQTMCGESLTDREYGDVLDAFGIAYWLALGEPRSGI